MLGRAVQYGRPPRSLPATGKKVAIIGGGPAGMDVAWHLALNGVEAHIFEKDDQLGGKLAQIIPWERLSQAIWDIESQAFPAHAEHLQVNLGVDMSKEKVDRAARRSSITWSSPSAPTSRGRIAFPGHERVIPALDYLKAAKSEKPMPSRQAGGHHRGRQCRL